MLHFALVNVILHFHFVVANWHEDLYCQRFPRPSPIFIFPARSPPLFKSSCCSCRGFSGNAPLLATSQTSWSVYLQEMVDTNGAAGRVNVGPEARNSSPKECRCCSMSAGCVREEPFAIAFAALASRRDRRLRECRISVGLSFLTRPTSLHECCSSVSGVAWRNQTSASRKFNGRRCPRRGGERLPHRFSPLNSNSASHHVHNADAAAVQTPLHCCRSQLLY